MTVDLSGLAAAFDADDWVQPYEHPGGPGTPSSEPLIREAFARRVKQGAAFEHRPTEVEYLVKWLKGTPTKLGWPATSPRVVVRHLRNDYAAFVASRKE